MKNADIREYTDRCWTELSEADRCYWASEYQRAGFQATLNASMVLRQHMKSIQQGWPDDTQRGRDLDYHIEFKQLLDRIVDALSTGSSLQRS